MESASQRIDAFGVLPPELRNEVYKNLLTSPDPVPFDDCRGLHPAILRVNKQYSAESLVLLYRKNTFSINNKSVFWILSKLPRSSHELIESIELCSNIIHLRRLPIYLDVCRGLPSLKELTIGTVASSFSMLDLEALYRDWGQVRTCNTRHISMSEHQWHELETLSKEFDFEGSSPSEAPIFNYLLQSALEMIEMLPGLRSLKLAGLLANAKLRAVEQVRGRVFNSKGERVFKEIEQ